MDLFQLVLLGEHLARAGSLPEVFDSRELYWLADASNAGQSAIARVRPSREEVIQYPLLEHIETGAIQAGGDFSIDVYRVQTQRLALGKVRAMVVYAFHGDAEAVYAEDLAAGNRHENWGIERERDALLRSLAPQPLSN
ncbi:hypothetical protein D3C87_1642280 [compost metagenome]